MTPNVILPPAIVREIEEILKSGKEAEVAIRNGKLIVWAVSNKKKCEVVISR